ncbi:MAG: nucleotidyltransferase family protein [Phycisphaerales bacterium]|nr:nucleotidyltransferase family protein [Phycisphaerales bacterium]
MLDTHAIPGLSAAQATALEGLCRARGVQRLRVFGSVARGEQTPESDLDVLVEFLPGVDPDLFELGGLQQDLSAVLGREVDLKTVEMFSEPALRRVIATSKLGYAA